MTVSRDADRAPAGGTKRGSEPRAKKRFGQHFLNSPNVIRRILDALEADAADTFLEIGPGPGTLTLPFSQRGFDLTVVETDGEMARHLRGLPFPNALTIIHADFLTLPSDHLFPKPTKVFSNLPYNVSVPMTAAMLRVSNQIPLLVLMYQKEVAERVRAVPRTKSYGIISVLTQLYYRCDLHFNVAPGAFRPPPKVMSQVIRLRRRDQPGLPLRLLPKMERLLRELFQQRRKTLRNLLRRGFADWPHRGGLLESLEACGIDSGLRPEVLDPDTYARWLLYYEGIYESSPP